MLFIRVLYYWLTVDHVTSIREKTGVKIFTIFMTYNRLFKVNNTPKYF